MLATGDKRMIRMIVDNYHVSTGDKQIMRNFWDRMKGKLDIYPYELRRIIYIYALECHKQNKDLYLFVMKG